MLIGMTPEDFSTFVASRHSVRDFRPDPVPQQTLDAIWADATTAPSRSNTRSYQLAIATGDRADRLRAGYRAAYDKVAPIRRKERGAKLRALLSGSLPDGDFKAWRPYPPDLRPRSEQVGRALYEHLGIARGDWARRQEADRANMNGFGAPVLGFVLVHRAMVPVSALDAGLMLQTVFLSAKAHGVDSCALGAFAIWRRVLATEFDLPRRYGLITGFALGYASDAPVNDFRARRPAVELVAAKRPG